MKTLKFNPGMPYHDPHTPYVNYWFSFSDGSTPEFFNEMMSDENIDRLATERGACIVYTHLADGFTVETGDGEYALEPEFESTMRNLARREDGWFVPVSTILDRLLAIKNVLVVEKPGKIVVANANSHDLEGLTIVVGPQRTYHAESGKVYQANHEGEIILGEIRAREVVTLHNDVIEDTSPGAWEKSKMVLERARLFIKHGRL